MARIELDQRDIDALESPAPEFVTDAMGTLVEVLCIMGGLIDTMEDSNV